MIITAFPQELKNKHITILSKIVNKYSSNNMKNRIPRKIKKQIPKNTLYCFEYTGKSGIYFDENHQTMLPYMRIKRCNLSFRNSFGYSDCRYLVKTFGKFNGENPDEFPDLALNDNCKSCGFSEGQY